MRVSTDVVTATSRRRRPAFTLVEALVSIAILAGLLLTLAVVFRQSSRLARRVRGGAAAFSAARQVFEALGRDLSGVTREGFLFIRTQELKIATGEPFSGLILYYDEDGTANRLNKGRCDVMVMTTAGYQVSAVDAAKCGNFARVIWAQSERVSGNNLAPDAGRAQFAEGVPGTPKLWAVNQVLCRHQTILLPDSHSSGVPNSAYGGGNRGADFFNMSVTDLTRFFGPAMGAGGEENLPYLTQSYGLFSSYRGEGYGELMPYRLSSAVWRFGRSGPGGDLSEAQVNVSIPHGLISGGSIAAAHERDDCIRGQERPKIFGPEDYHRIAAFGVGSFQVDFSDGRRMAVQDANDNWVGTRLQFYPSDLGLSCSLSTELMGPGVKRTFCWNALSPTSIRDTSLREAFVGTTYRTRYRKDGAGNPANWRDVNFYTQNMFNTSSAYGDKLGDAGWPWPRAIRVRLLIFDTTEAPPVAYEFEQIFHVLVQ